MMLNRDQIIERELVRGDVDEHAFRDAGYDLRISSLIGKDEKGVVSRETDDYDLLPM